MIQLNNNVQCLSKYHEITLDTLDNFSYTLDIHMTNTDHLFMEVNMAMANQKTRIGEMQCQSALSSALLQPTCLRCGGFMVNEVSMDLMSSTGELDCVTRRCVQCGDILDPVILRNRRIRQVSLTVPRAAQSSPTNKAMHR